MGESAKILNPEKTVLMPDETADCPMAHMADIDRIEELRKEYPDLAVVCYINSTAELKCHADVCVTSSNAIRIVKALPNKNIFFIPDENLGRFVAKQVPEKNFIFNDGYCHVHASIRKDQVEAAKKLIRMHLLSFTRSAAQKFLIWQISLAVHPKSLIMLHLPMPKNLSLVRNLAFCMN